LEGKMKGLKSGDGRGLEGFGKGFGWKIWK
jgi:hypothetical protein